jgi:tetratricopeptide (TPR) repeat protein
MANALDILGAVSWARGEYATARSQLEEAAGLYQEVGDSWRHGRCLTQLARINTAQGEYEQARQLLEQSLAIYRALGDKERIGWVLYLQARLLFLSEQDIDAANSLTRQSLTLLQEIDNPWERAVPLVLLGQLTLRLDRQGKKGQARDLFEESRISFKEAGDGMGRVNALMGLASIAVLESDLTEASTLYQECLKVAVEADHKEGIALSLEGLAATVAAQGAPVRAAQLWGAAEALREAIGAPIQPVYRADYEQAVANACNQAGNEAFAGAWEEGRTMKPGQLLR